ncbi:HpcH/HpaI aldolase family protein [Myceligenerans salitolerans]|uniref:2-dehydro-3-deoxyglucarate aldolase n=1 Tax=Myceligenerans salitolerans TaxID=1230528 RepID=A0ABS3IAP7_9MICO|nr:aldolase/citrate lyase family protein [Myceligenerans salitolerans]MBO0610101.1 2-dehydro-3-deoxyglucarate aldolase [Myceligenerans salitolerans]
MPIQLKPTFREILADRAQAGEGRPLAGMWVSTGSPLVAEICAGSGLDWLLVDMEHGPNGIEGVLPQLQATAAYPPAVVVRLPGLLPVMIKQVLDLGAQNVLLPMIDTADQAETAVRAVRYPPRGFRGVGSALARSARWNRVEDYLTDGDEHVSLLVQVESEAGVENAAEIAAVDGVDGVFVGPSDLAASMGLLGQQTHPDVTAAVLRAVDAVRGAGKPVGVNAFDPAVADSYLAAGASFVLVGADVTLLARGSEALAARFRTTSGRAATG